VRFVVATLRAVKLLEGILVIHSLLFASGKEASQPSGLGFIAGSKSWDGKSFITLIQVEDIINNNINISFLGSEFLSDLRFRSVQGLTMHTGQSTEEEHNHGVDTPSKYKRTFRNEHRTLVVKIAALTSCACKLEDEESELVETKFYLCLHHSLKS